MKKKIGDYLALSLFTLFAIVVIFSCFKFVKVFANNEISDNLDDWSNYSTCLAALFTFVSLTFIYLTYKKQSDSNYKLQFDSTFFNMLHTQREILSSFGVCFFKQRYEKIMTYYPLSWSEELSSEEAFERVRKAYNLSLKEPDDSSAMHYFRHLYHIVKLVHNSSFNYKKKCEYINIIQAQMSNEELFVMFYNVVSFGNKECLQWLDYYRFFENLRSTGSLFDKIRKHFFHNTEFKYSAPNIDNRNIILD